MKFKVGDKVRAMWNGEEGKVRIELLCSRCGQNPVPDDETGERLGLCPPCANEEETLKGGV